MAFVARRPGVQQKATLWDTFRAGGRVPELEGEGKCEAVYYTVGRVCDPGRVWLPLQLFYLLTYIEML